MILYLVAENEQTLNKVYLCMRVRVCFGVVVYTLLKVVTLAHSKNILLLLK